MDSDATRKDGEDEDVMAQVIRQNNELSNEGFEEVVDDDLETLEGEEIEEEIPEEVVAEEVEEEVKPLTIKVDGEVKDVTPEEVADRLGVDPENISDKNMVEYQKQVAADVRFNELDKKSKALAAKEKELEAKAKAIPAKEEAPVDLSELHQQYADAVLTDDIKAQEKAFDALIAAKVSSQGTNTAEIMQQATIATQKILYDNEVKKAQKKFALEHKDILANPILNNAVNTEAQKVWEADKGKDPWDVLDTAAKNVRQAFGKPEVKPHPKKTSAKPIKAAAAKADIGKDKPPPPTRKQTVASMVADREAGLR